MLPHNLSAGRQQSCGCLHRERARDANIKHGFAGSVEFATWQSMMNRCARTDLRYRRYGGRGIKVCERWHKFQNFLADMGPRPERTSLDRINNDGDYEPENCRWATAIQQANNTSKCVFLEHNGERRTQAQWARLLGLNPTTIRSRIFAGMPMSRVLDPALRKGRRTDLERFYSEPLVPSQRKGKRS